MQDRRGCLADPWLGAGLVQACLQSSRRSCYLSQPPLPPLPLKPPNFRLVSQQPKLCLEVQPHAGKAINHLAEGRVLTAAHTWTQQKVGGGAANVPHVHSVCRCFPSAAASLCRLLSSVQQKRRKQS